MRSELKIYTYHKHVSKKVFYILYGRTDDRITENIKGSPSASRRTKIFSVYLYDRTYFYPCISGVFPINI